MVKEIVRGNRTRKEKRNVRDNRTEGASPGFDDRDVGNGARRKARHRTRHRDPPGDQRQPKLRSAVAEQDHDGLEDHHGRWAEQGQASHQARRVRSERKGSGQGHHGQDCHIGQVQRSVLCPREGPRSGIHQRADHDGALRPRQGGG